MTGVPFQAPGFPMMRIVGGVGGAILVAGLAAAGWFVKARFAPGQARTSSYGIDSKRADPEKMIAAAGTLARSWKSDATFMKISMPSMQADGTVDLTKHNAVVEYFSLSRVQSASSLGRKDAIKKYNFVNSDMILYKDRWDATNQWKGPMPIATVPACKSSQLAAKVPGFTAGKTAVVTLDPDNPKGLVWIVNFEGKTLFFDPATCAPR